MYLNLISLTFSLLTLALVIYIFLNLKIKDTKDSGKSKNLENIFESVSKDINEIENQLSSVTTPINELNRFLGGNVTTGRLGEWNLESIVKDIMPRDSYFFQHKINSQTDDRVDCAILTAEEVLVPVDSKFYSGQFRNFQESSSAQERSKVLKDLRTSILRDAQDIKDKYILKNSTSNYAILYIASEKLIDLIDSIEGIRQECLTEKKILIQGPNTLAAFLDTIRVGHHYLKLNETAEKVAKVVSNIEKEFNNFDKSTENVQKKLEGAIKEVNSLHTRINVLGSTLKRGSESLDDQKTDG